MLLYTTLYITSKHFVSITATPGPGVHCPATNIPPQKRPKIT